MTPIVSVAEMIEGSSNHEEQRFHTLPAKLVVILIIGLRAANYMKLVARD